VREPTEAEVRRAAALAFVRDLSAQHTYAERVLKWEAENEDPYEGGDDIEDVYDGVIRDARALLGPAHDAPPASGKE